MLKVWEKGKKNRYQKRFLGKTKKNDVKENNDESDDLSRSTADIGDEYGTA